MQPGHSAHLFRAGVSAPPEPPPTPLFISPYQHSPEMKLCYWPWLFGSATSRASSNFQHSSAKEHSPNSVLNLLITVLSF